LILLSLKRANIKTAASLFNFPQIKQEHTPQMVVLDVKEKVFAPRGEVQPCWNLEQQCPPIALTDCALSVVSDAAAITNMLHVFDQPKVT
jgi:hypothetical protein